MTECPVPVGGPAPQSAEAGRGTRQLGVIGPDSTDRENEVLVLRERGRSFASIARALGFEGAGLANAAFNRALQRLPPSEQEGLRKNEVARLDALGERLRQRQDLDEAEMARRVRALERLRKRLGT